jgi:hypothetical protein
MDGLVRDRRRVFAPLHDARPVLLNFVAPGAPAVEAARDRVKLVDAAFAGACELPLIRPDGAHGKARCAVHEKGAPSKRAPHRAGRNVTHAGLNTTRIYHAGARLHQQAAPARKQCAGTRWKGRKKGGARPLAATRPRARFLHNSLRRRNRRRITDQSMPPHRGPEGEVSWHTWCLQNS